MSMIMTYLPEMPVAYEYNDIVFYLKKNRMVRSHAPFSWRHAPFDKKNVAPCIADVPFFISSNDP